MRLMARLRRMAEIKGCVAGAQLVAVLAHDDVAHPVEAVLDGPMPSGLGGDLLGRGVGHGKGSRTRWATSVVVLLPPPRLLTVLVRRIRTAWAAPGKSIHAGASTAWTVRRTRLP